MSLEFRNLFSPIKIGNMTVRNRIHLSPHQTLYINPFNGVPTDKYIHYLAARAKGGAGIVETYLTQAHYDKRYDNFHAPGWVEIHKRGADVVHKYGAKFICQVANMGGQAGNAPNTGPIFAPSAIPVTSASQQQHIPHAMTKDEIKRMVEAFAYGAASVKATGADGVSIHAGHGYLISEFMSPYFNRRKDEYGGNLENRLRFLIEIIKAVRNEVGDDFVMGIRLNADDFLMGGYTLDDFLVMVPMITKASKLDYLNITVGTYSSTAAVIESMYYPLNSFVYCAAAVKQIVDIPVIARGRITDPVQAEQILANNQADMVSMVRALIADPELPNKAKEGRVDEIRKCLGCNEGCWRRIALEPNLEGVSCTMNPAMGKEGEPGWGNLEPAKVKRRVMVIGGGPAGLEAARVLALRGHQVSLYEKSPELGGQTLIAAKAPGRDGFLDLGRYYTYQMKLLGVNTHLNTEATIETVSKESPDVVVVATGSTPIIPDIKGLEKIVDVSQILNGEVEAGDKVVILGTDEDIQSLSTADFLAERGKKVEIICPGYVCGVKVEPCTRESIYQRLLQKGVILSPITRVKEISGSKITVYNVFTFEERVIEDVDTLVISYGYKENNELYYALLDQGIETHVIGDAYNVRRINDATMDGAVIGRMI